MQITRIEGFKDSLKAAVDLPVSSSGMNITVGSAFFVLGSSYSLTEDFTATLTADPANETWYTLYLAIENSTGGVVVFMDDIVKDGAEEVYSWKGGPFTRLHQIMSIVVPAGTTNLDNVGATVWVIVEQPEE